MCVLHCVTHDLMNICGLRRENSGRLEAIHSIMFPTPPLRLLYCTCPEGGCSEDAFHRATPYLGLGLSVLKAAADCLETLHY